MDIPCRLQLLELIQAGLRLGNPLANDFHHAFVEGMQISAGCQRVGKRLRRNPRRPILKGLAAPKNLADQLLLRAGQEFAQRIRPIQIAFRVFHGDLAIEDGDFVKQEFEQVRSSAGIGVVRGGLTNDIDQSTAAGQTGVSRRRTQGYLPVPADG